MNGKTVLNKKLIKCIALSIFLMTITILPSFEAIELRYRKNVDLNESPAQYQLKSGDVIEQRLLLDREDRIDDLRIWISADEARENKGSLKVLLTQGNIASEDKIDTSCLVGEEYVATNLKLSKFTDGQIDLKIDAAELEDDSSVFIRYTSGGAVYGLPNAIINGRPCVGTLSLNFTIRQPHDVEFIVSLCTVLFIILISILSSIVIIYTVETAKTGWLLVGLYVLLAMGTYVLQYPRNTWEGESFAEGAAFFYHNAANMGIADAMRQLEGGMYLSSVQSILMIIVVRILHLRTYAHVAIQSLSTFFWIMCLAPFCSHYFKKYFTRTFRFIFPLVVSCYGFVCEDYTRVGYYGAFFLLLLMAYDFETLPNILYAIIIAQIPAICTSKMMFVVFAPVALVYYILFRREMNRKKKGCVAMIGFCSLMEGVLSILLRRGVQSGHSLGTIQHVALPMLVNKILYYTVQVLGIQLRCGVLNGNQMLNNACSAIILIGIIAFAIWQIYRKGSNQKEAKFILVMLSLIITQCSVIILTTTDWHANISWRQSVNAFSGIAAHFLNIRVAASLILLIALQICINYFEKHFEHLKEHLRFSEQTACQVMASFLAVCMTLFYINQNPGPKDFGAANPTRSSKADWKTYVSMLDSDAFCIQIEHANTVFYRRNSSVQSVAIPRTAQVDVSDVAELNGKKAIVLYAHKAAATNQILDKYYYMSIYDKDGNLISRLRQLNPDPERLYIAFYPDAGVTNIGRVEFTHEDGSPAFVDGAVEIGYR